MNTINITPIFNAVIALLAALITCFLIPWIKEKLSAEKYDKLIRYANIAVMAAEQMFTPEEWASKRVYVDDYLNSLGYEIDQTAENAIEAAVLQVHESLKK